MHDQTRHKKIREARNTVALQVHHLTPSVIEASQNGVDLEHPFSMVPLDPAAHREKFITAAAAAGAQSAYKVDDYVHNMPAVGGLIEAAASIGDPRPFENTSILMIQHITAEVLGCISVLRSLGCKDLVTVFVGYNADAEKAYRPDLMDLPADESRCFILANSTATSAVQAQGVYSVKRDFTILPEDENARMPYDQLDQAMASHSMTFIQAMRCLCLDTFFKQLVRSSAAGRELIILEDGGYITPILNQAALEGKTVTDVRQQYFCPPDAATDAALGPSLLMADVLKNHRVTGSVEYTRNGYDHDVDTQNACGGKLFMPNMAVSVSFKKTQIEADGVAESCLTAIASAMASYGKVLKYRNALVIGSRGNIGRWFIRALYARLDRRGWDSDEQPAVIGCDIKVGRQQGPNPIPTWQKRDDEPALPDIDERASYADFDKARVRELDLVIGITGGPTPGHQTMGREQLIDWLVNGTKDTMFIASGSTKTDEFPDLLAWINEILPKGPDLPGREATVTKFDFTDALSKRSFGARYQFAINAADGAPPQVKNVIFLNNLMPINFLFFGVPTEIIDQTLAQLLSVTANLHRQAPKIDQPRVFAIDYDRIASENVYGAVQPLPEQDIPIPPST
ncbi:MAG TPA: hypothetical protein VD886_15410, partial [Herpetosiphonaceae bacterium]|nr:hypothetical protein [Herpetosiphonaceae bacterium]